MVRKIFNNTTTTSHAFGVTVTIVFHEVRMFGVDRMYVDEKTTPATYYPAVAPGPVRYLLGKEAYKDIPGDLRQQFYAVLDRANLVVKPTTAWAPNTVYTRGAVVTTVAGNAYVCVNPGLPVGGGISANTGSGPAGTGTNIPDGTVFWNYTSLLPSQPFTTEFDGRLNDVSSISANPNPAVYAPHPPGTYNLYLSNSVPTFSSVPYSRLGYGSHTTTFYMDGRPITIGPVGLGGNYQGPLVIGTGTNQEVVTWNYVNEDGSINVNRTNTQIVHAEGEVVASFVTGNPGPITTFGWNPRPFDPMAANNPFRAVVPYAQRVR